MNDDQKITISNSLVAERNAKQIVGGGAPALRLETLAVRAGAELDPETGALSPALHLSTTFEHGPASEAIHKAHLDRDPLERSSEDLGHPVH